MTRIPRGMPAEKRREHISQEGVEYSQDEVVGLFMVSFNILMESEYC
jgi:hypothetical protein